MLNTILKIGFSDDPLPGHPAHIPNYMIFYFAMVPGTMASLTISCILEDKTLKINNKITPTHTKFQEDQQK